MMLWRRGGVVGCIHPGDSIPLEVRHNHGRCVYYAYLWMSDHHDVLSDQNGPPVASQTNQSPLGPNDRLFETKTKNSQLFYVTRGIACRLKPCKITGENVLHIPEPCTI